MGRPEPDGDGLGRLLVDEDLSLLGALAEHGDHPPAEVDIADVEGAHLGHPKTPSVQQLENGIVPQIGVRSALVVGVVLEQEADVLVPEHLGQA